MAVLNIGWIAVFSIGLGFGAGLFLDWLLGTGPVLTLVLMVVGIVSGFYCAYRQIMKLTRDDERD